MTQPTHEGDVVLAKAVRDSFAAFKLAVLTAKNAGLSVRISEEAAKLKSSSYGAVDPDELKPEQIKVHRPL